MTKYAAVLLLFLCPRFASAQTCEHIGPSNFQIALVEFQGLESLDPDVNASIIADLQKEVTEECQFRDELHDRIQDEFLRRGYLKVRVDEKIALWELSETSGLKKVAVKVKVNLGQRYRLEHVAFTGGTVFTETDLRSMVPMKDGDIFDVERMRQALKNFRDNYVARGYLNFTPVPNTEINDEKKTVAITFDLDEGARLKQDGK